MKKIAKLILFIIVLTFVLTVVRTIAIGLGVNVFFRNLILGGLGILIAFMFGYLRNSKKPKS